MIDNVVIFGLNYGFDRGFDNTIEAGGRIF